MNRLLAPVTAGLAAAAIAFAAVALATDGGDERPSAASADGRGLFVSMGCGSCHHLTAAGANGQIGPDLDVELDEHTRESLTAKIREPGPASIMPGDFDARMTDAELAALVDFLLATR